MAEPLTARVKVQSIVAGAIAGATASPPPKSITVATVFVDETGEVPAGTPPLTQSFTSTDPAAKSFFMVGECYELAFTPFDPKPAEPAA